MARPHARWGLALLLVGALAASARADPPVARVLLFTSAECPHCQRVKAEVVPPLRARFAERLDLRDWDIAEPAHYEALMAIEDAHAVPFAERVVPVAVIGDRLVTGADAIEAELPGLVEAAIDAGGNAWPAGVEVAEAPRAAPPGSDVAAPSEDAPIWVAFLEQTGCRECSRVRADLAYVRARHPRVRVEAHNVYDDAALGTWLARRVGRELATPAVFVGDDALIGAGEVEARALERMIARYETPAGAPRVWDAMPTEEAREELVARFRSLGPLAVMAAGLVDGINPCAFATLIFFVSYLSVSGRKGRQVLAAGAAFTIGVFLAYLAVGLGLYRALDLLGDTLPTLGRVLMLATAAVCAILAVFSFRDYLAARRGALKDMALVLPDFLRERIHAVVRRGKRARFYVTAAFVTGMVVSLLELACTGQVYLPTIIFVTSVPELRGAAIAYLVLYNVLFVLPLVIVFALVYLGTTSKQLIGWLERHAKSVKLGLTAFFVALTVWLVLAAIPSGGAAQPAPEGPEVSSVAVGRPAPALEVEWLVGEGPAGLDRARHRVKLLLFFSAMCPACREALGPVDRVAREDGARVTVLGISEDHPRMLRGLFAERPVAFPVGRASEQTFDRWGITHVPTMVIVEGATVRHVLVGTDGIAALPGAMRATLAR